jgi:hypothetical protein
MVSSRAARLFQAEQVASMMCSMPSKTVLDSQLARRNCQTFSTGFSSGARDGMSASCHATRDFLDVQLHAGRAGERERQVSGFAARRAIAPNSQVLS